MSNRNIDRIREGLSNLVTTPNPNHIIDALRKHEVKSLLACLDELESDYTETKRALRKMNEREEKP